jgi:diguanylate cyclase (GGDEF)-like protein/PAS domain S-box-containing protein
MNKTRNNSVYNLVFDLLYSFVLLLLIPIMGYANSMNIATDKLHKTIDNQNHTQLTEQERNWLLQHPVIRVAMDPDWAPVEYRDEQGEFHGISMDYLSLLENYLGITFEAVKDLSWQQAVESVKNKQADMFASVTYTIQREEYAVFTDPYITIPIRIFARDDISYIGSIDNILDKRIAVVENYAIHDLLMTDYPEISLLPVKTPSEGLSLLSKGKVDAFIGNVITASYYIGKLGLSNIRTSGETTYSNKQAMAVRKDWPILANILQKGLNRIPPYQHDQIFNSWMSIKFGPKLNYRLIWQISTFAILLLLLILYWNRRLAKEIRQRRLVESKIRDQHSLLENLVQERTSALKENEARVRLILESIGEGVYAINKNGEVTIINPAATQMLGYSAEELIGKTIHSIVHHSYPDGSPYPKEECQIYKTVRNSQFELIGNEVLWRKDGTSFPIEYQCMPIKNEKETIGSVISFKDITERKQAETQLLAEQQRTEEILTGTNAGTWYWNIETDELIINDRWANIIGYTLDELSPITIGTWSDSLYPDDLKNAELMLEKHFNHELDYYDVEFRQKHKNGEWIWINARGKVVVWDIDGKPRRMTGTHLDITGRKIAEERLLHQAHFDTLTELPNRFLALNRLSQLILEARRHNNHLGIFFIDLDDFKKINDTLGHDVGDDVLIEVSKRLQHAIRDSDTVGRLGGDEFIVLVNDLTDVSAAGPVAEKLLESFRNSFKHHDRELILSASIGISIYPDDGDNASELLRNADSAMYHSKREGRNTYSYFTDAMNRDNSRRLLLEEQMHGALERGEFRLCYQPKINLKTRRVVGVEALLRWDNQTLGNINPNEFIPLAEHTGLIVTIGQFVLNEALCVATKWQTQYKEPIYIAINLSPNQFRDPKLVSFIEKLIGRTGIDPKLIEFEITEGVFMSGLTQILDAMITLTNRGIAFAMDDFGTGYSSLNYLRTYPFNTLKIDRSFVKDITEDNADLELVNAAIAMAHALGLKVVAEGVETDEQLTLLSNNDCDIAQGFLLGKPVTLEKITAILDNQNADINYHSN